MNAAHRAELRTLAGHHGLSRPQVSGSVLRGGDTKESDLDLLVDTAETAGTFALAAFKREADKREAETLSGVPVSVPTPGALPLKSRSVVLQQAQAL